jgi:hypothetical protein
MVLGMLNYLTLLRLVLPNIFSNLALIGLVFIVIYKFLIRKINQWQRLAEYDLKSGDIAL